MFSFKQSKYIIDFKFIGEDFEYYVTLDDGERLEIDKNVHIKTINSLFYDSCFNLSFHKNHLKSIKDVLIKIRSDLLKININFFAHIKLHNEKVRIDEKFEDDRSYGFCKIILKDNLNNIYMDDIPLGCKNLNGLEEKIIKRVKQNIKKISLTNKTLKHKNLKLVPVIFSSAVAGYFIHEILGHCLEGDFFSYYKNNFNDLKISPKLTVVDSVNGYEKIIGFNKYDDMGLPAKPLTLVEKGNIKNILSIEKNNSFDGNLYGVARRESYKLNVLPRMRATFIKPYESINESEIISKYSNGIFFDKAYRGGVSPQSGDYIIEGHGYMIKDGEKQNFIGNLKLTGSLLKDLNSIEYIGNDFKVFGNYCSKLDQTVRVAVGGPTISINGMFVEGDIYGIY